jgi:hypothetical protein
MKDSPALLHGLDLLSEGLTDPVVDLRAVLSVLTDDLNDLIPAYIGLTVTLHVDENPVILSTLEAVNTNEIRASLLLPLCALWSSEIDGSVTFYSGTAGAFVDLADDAEWILGLDCPPLLDVHLPFGSVDPPGIRGLTPISEINQAIGVLIEDGHTPSDARTELRRRAARTGQTVAATAHQLLDTLPRPDPAIRS